MSDMRICLLHPVQMDANSVEVVAITNIVKFFSKQTLCVSDPDVMNPHAPLTRSAFGMTENNVFEEGYMSYLQRMCDLCDLTVFVICPFDGVAKTAEDKVLTADISAIAQAMLKKGKLVVYIEKVATHESGGAVWIPRPMIHLDDFTHLTVDQSKELLGKSGVEKFAGFSA